MIKDMEVRISQLQLENQQLREEEKKEEQIRQYKTKLTKLGDENESIQDTYN